MTLVHPLIATQRSTLNVTKAFAFIAAIALCNCSPPESTCSEPDASGWVASTYEWLTPIRCDAKIIGYRLDIDSSKDNTSRTVSIVNQDPATSNSVTIAADIDMGGGVTRTARIIQGPVTRAESLGTITTVSASTTTAEPGPLLSEFVITVNGGSHYIGEFRNVRRK